MKENINEHDMTKRMMEIIRNSQKTLIKEVEEPINNLAQQPELVPGDDLPEEESQSYESPTDNSAEPLEGFDMDDTYIQMDKDDQRFKDLSNQLLDIANAQVTSIYISSGDNGKQKDLVIVGVQNGLVFTMSLNQPDVRISGTSDASQADGTKKLQGFRDNLNSNMGETKQFLYDNNLDGKKGV